jgi:hypothetical protein
MARRSLSASRISPGEDHALNCHRQLAVDEIAGRQQELFEKERIAAGAADASRGELLLRPEAAGDGLRLGEGQRGEVDGDMKTAGRRRPPAGVVISGSAAVGRSNGAGRQI